MENLSLLSIFGLIFVGVSLFALGSVGTWFLIGSRINQIKNTCSELERELHETQKTIHKNDSLFLEKTNRNMISHADKLKEAKAEAYEQGRQLGLVEAKSQHLEAIIALRKR